MEIDMNPSFTYHAAVEEIMAWLRKKTVARTIRLLGGILLYVILFQILYNWIRYDVIIAEPYDFKGFAVQMFKNYFPILAIFGINIYAVMYLWSNNSVITRYLPLKIMVDICICLSGTIAVDYLALWIYGNIHWAGTLLNCILSLLLVEVVYYFKRSEEAVLRAETAKREVLQYQYNTLKSQINPHFLFNSLNILYSLISIDTERSKKFVIRLSQMYRYIMAHQNVRSTPLSEEIEFLNSYVSVLEMRYHNKFGMTIDNADNVEMEKVSIIPFTLQLLVENVTKHNVISSNQPMSITFTLSNKYLTVSNPIRKKMEASSSTSTSGIGLRYIAEQYRLHDKYFEVFDDGVTFTAKVPYL